MSNDKSTKNLFAIFEECLSLEENSINLESNSSNYEEWDSLGTLSIFSALEESYKIKLDILEIKYLSSVSTIIELLRLKGIVI